MIAQQRKHSLAHLRVKLPGLLLEVSVLVARDRAVQMDDLRVGRRQRELHKVRGRLDHLHVQDPRVRLARAHGEIVEVDRQHVPHGIRRDQTCERLVSDARYLRAIEYVQEEIAPALPRLQQPFDRPRVDRPGNGASGSNHPCPDSHGHQSLRVSVGSSNTRPWCWQEPQIAAIATRSPASGIPDFTDAPAPSNNTGSGPA